jgi:hypothetical protein
MVKDTPARDRVTKGEEGSRRKSIETGKGLINLQTGWPGSRQVFSGSPKIFAAGLP